MYRKIIAIVMMQSLLGCWFSVKNLGDDTESELVVFANDLIQGLDSVSDNKRPLVWLG